MIFIDGISKITTTLDGNRGKYVIYTAFDAITTLTLYQIAFVSWLINEACKIAHTLYFTFWGIHTYKRKIHLSLLTSFSKVAKGSKKFPKCIFSIWLMEKWLDAFKFTPHLNTAGNLGYDIRLINIKIPCSHDLYMLL